MLLDVGAAAWVAQITNDDLLADVDDGTFSRAVGYADGGMVETVATADRGRVLVGEVHGNALMPYRVLVTRVGPDGRHPLWESRCSCPVGEACKHAVAVLLVTRDALRAQGDDGDWESLLGGLIDGDPKTDTVSGAGLGLVLDEVVAPRSRTDSTPTRRFRLRPTRRTKAGTWAKNVTWNELGDSYRTSRYSRMPPVREDHRELLLELKGLHEALHGWTGYGYGNPVINLDGIGPQVWQLLRRGVDLGLGMVTSDLTTPVELAAEPGEIVLDVSRGPDGVRVLPRLSTAEPGDDELVLVGDPPHGVVHQRAAGPTLVPLARSIDPAVTKLVSDGRVVTVPDADADRFVSLYLPRLHDRVAVVSGDGSVEVPEPVPPKAHVLVQRAGDDGVTFTFGFAYAGEERLHVVPAEAVPGDASVPRDRSAERALVARLDVLDGIPGARRSAATTLRDRARSVAGRSAHEPSAAAKLTLATSVTVRLMDAVRAVTDVVPLLEDHPEVVVEAGADLPAYEEIRSDPRVSVDVAGEERGDWLDLGISVTVGDEEVPFEPLFQALARGEEAMLLESGAWFRLDHPSLGDLRDLIEEARGLADARRGEIRLSRYQIGLWDELVELAVDVDREHAWAQSVEALRSLDAVVDAPVPPTVKATLRPYQREGFQWLATLWDAGLGGVLADDMGLGKTVQALALVARAAEAGDLEAPVLVVAPTSVVGTWANEAARFVPSLDVRTVTATHKRRGTHVAEEVAGAHLVVTSYAVLRIDADQFADAPWRAVLLDEAQAVKNPQAKTHLAVRRLDAPFVLAVTGTPLENSLMDLWSLLRLAAPGLYPHKDRFTETYRRPIESGEQPEMLDRLRRRLRPLMLRRTKEQVALDLPPKQIQLLEVDLTPAHRRIYDRHLQRERQRILGLLDDPDANRVAILSSLTRLRQLSLDPALVDDEHKGRVTAAKVEVLVEHLQELASEGHRALVFSQFTRFLRSVEARLAAEGVSTCYLDGSTRKRQEVIDEFRGGDATAFLISLKAGGVGLTLTEADYVFVLDPWWNPATEAQAIDRTHRIGQDKPVMVYRLVSTGTIEEKVVALQERKRDLFDRVVDSGGALSGAITSEDIRALLDTD